MVSIESMERLFKTFLNTHHETDRTIHRKGYGTCSYLILEPTFLEVFLFHFFFWGSLIQLLYNPKTLI